MIHCMHDIMHDVKEACCWLEDAIEQIACDECPHTSKNIDDLVRALEGLKAAMKVKHMYEHMKHHPDHAEHDMSKGNPMMEPARRDKHGEIAARHNPY